MKNQEKEKEFRKQVRQAIKMIEFVKKKERPVKASGTYITVGNYTNEE